MMIKRLTSFMIAVFMLIALTTPTVAVDKETGGLYECQIYRLCLAF